MISCDDLYDISTRVRIQVLQMIHQAGAGHTGGSLSSVDILTSLYFAVMKYSVTGEIGDFDRFILSKGHSVEAYYAVLAAAGYFPAEKLKTYGQYKTDLFAHPTRHAAGVEVPTGALGHGLSIGTGMAIAGKRDGKKGRVFVLMGDGEQAEGSVWEAAMSAAHYNLGNLTAIIDYNKLQISGRVDEVMKTSSLVEKWQSFGWKVVETDGNNHKQLLAAFEYCGREEDVPVLILAHTVKGKGVSFMEDSPGWHHRVPNEEELKRAINELTSGQKEGE